MINQNVASDGWVLCEKHMPEELGVHMLVTRQLTHYLQYVDIASWPGKAWYTGQDGGFTKIYDVIAWQNLPLPYNPHSAKL